ncbi:MAG TPA: glycosyltransferase [Gemmatimonadales bacterium]|nr:glycosyltransferase [Gemmatimonadales bacterium]
MSRDGPIAFFLPSLRGGGAQRVIVNLAHGIIERGLPVDVVLGAATGVFLDQLPPAVRLVDLRARRLLRSIGPLSRYLRRERPRVLVSSMSHGNLVALWAAKLAGRATPVVVTVHNTMSQSTPQQGALAGGLWPHLLRTFYPWARCVVAVSHGAADDLARTSGLPRNRVRVVYNPVITPSIMALARERPDHPWFDPGQPPVILGVGRLTKQKDFPTLIRAFAEVRRRRPARLIILGEGEDRPLLESLIGELRLKDDVALPGFRENAMAYMAGSALFVLSSAWEGLPTVLIEALAAGTRVVSTDCPSGPREILQEGRLGVLVPVGDVAALAEAMIDTLDRPGSTVPPDALTAFTRDAAVDHYLSLIESPQ